jgi:hypothetical protein
MTLFFLLQSISQIKMADQMQFAPFRPVNDIVGQAEFYSIPDFKDLERVNNRITNNLLYYQTNYILFFLALFILMGIIHPVEFAAGLVAFVGIFGAILFFTKKNPQIERIKRDKPFLSLGVILIVAAFLFNLFGSMLMFLFAICMPILLIFLHAAMRLRNLKNKAVNKAETIGFTRTPMGFILEQLELIVDKTSKNLKNE